MKSLEFTFLTATTFNLATKIKFDKPNQIEALLFYFLLNDKNKNKVEDYIVSLTKDEDIDRLDRYYSDDKGFDNSIFDPLAFVREIEDDD